MAAPLFPVNAHRFDPYLSFKFLVAIDGQTVAGLRKMSALKKKTEVAKWRSAGSDHESNLPGATTYEPVTLEQGLTHDPVFENWANLVNNFEGDAAMSLKNYCKTISVSVVNLQGVVALTYVLRRAWVSEYQALPELDAGSPNTVAIQTITLQHDGWYRDTAVTEPAET